MARTMLAVVAVLACASAAAAASLAPAAAEAFEAWRVEHGRSYASPAEVAKAQAAFAYNMRRVAELNAGEPDSPFGMNKFSDLTPEEFQQRYLMPKGALANSFAARRNMTPVADLTPFANVTVPRDFDWRYRGKYVTAVKNQGQCGSCWAFSATENIESVWALQGKHELVELSVQQIVSCDKVDAGCNGGDLPTAFKYVQHAGGLELEKNYPYASGGGETHECKDHKRKELAHFDGWEYASKNKNETEMQLYLANHAPLAICVDAETWQHYKGGILKHSCGTQLDHCVMATGFGEADGTPYWSIRNSWASDWGENGYIRVERNKNLCGVASEPASVYIRK